MSQNTNIIYLGLNIETFFFLKDQEDFNIVGIGYLDIFKVHSLNPVNLIFKIIYFLRCKNKFRSIELGMLFFWYLFEFLSSSVFKKYARYLKLISNQRVEIIDIENPEVIENLKKTVIDVIVVNAWGILPKEVLSIPRLGVVNIHPSMLPKYRGSLPTLWSLKNKDEKSAVSYMILNSKMDAGNILNQHIFSLGKKENWLSMENKIVDIIRNTFIADLRRYINGEIVPYPQDERETSGTGKYLDYMQIDWHNELAEDIYNKINLYPFLEPGLYCYFYLGGYKIEIKRTQEVKKDLDLKNKTFLIKGINIFFKSKNGVLKSRLFIDLNFKSSCIIFMEKIKKNI